MEQTISTNKQSKKKVWIIAAVILAVIGVGIYTFALKKSPKAQYFLAELDSIEQVTDFFDERFKLEKSWMKYQKSNPIGMQMDVSGNYREYDYSSSSFIDTEEIVNNTKLSIDAEWDHKKQLASMALQPNVMGAKLDGATIAIDEHELLIELPFIKDVLAITDVELNNYTDMYADVSLDFTSLFNQGDADSPMDTSLEKYGQFIYDYLPNEAFTLADERININGQEMKTKRITLQLSEQEVKDFIKELIYEIRNDEDTLDLLAQRFSYTGLGEPAMIKEDIREVLAEVQKDFKDLRLRDGLTSTIWIHNKNIVQRELEMNIKHEVNQAKLVFEGEQTIDRDGLYFDYKLALTNEEYGAEAGLYLEGDFSGDPRDADDHLSFTADMGSEPVELYYESSEQLDKEEKNFDRRIGLRTGYEEATLDWSGFYLFDGGRFVSDNSFSVDGSGIDMADASLQVNVEAEKIREVTMPDKSKVKNIGNMSEEAIDDYIYEVVEPGLERWMMGSFFNMSAF